MSDRVLREVCPESTLASTGCISKQGAEQAERASLGGLEGQRQIEAKSHTATSGICARNYPAPTMCPTFFERTKQGPSSINARAEIEKGMVQQCGPLIHSTCLSSLPESLKDSFRKWKKEHLIILKVVYFPSSRTTLSHLNYQLNSALPSKWGGSFFYRCLTGVWRKESTKDTHSVGKRYRQKWDLILETSTKYKTKPS